MDTTGRGRFGSRLIQERRGRVVSRAAMGRRRGRRGAALGSVRKRFGTAGARLLQAFFERDRIDKVGQVRRRRNRPPGDPRQLPILCHSFFPSRPPGQPVPIGSPPLRGRAPGGRAPAPDFLNLIA
jgi:hypothetical protein